ncbi:hypothetical protein [Corynebacterium auriscanis]|uniref:hypothetical protein n=1 Tax=Corynebacterium auriscanis TaxID=99807 RepID=UPI002247B09C|nr:hypothetical protein [Corynebacterium auriscanis]MCX2163930.1 hypothetical protein [Corynebacterium auriscanis]
MNNQNPYGSNPHGPHNSGNYSAGNVPGGHNPNNDQTHVFGAQGNPGHGGQAGSGQPPQPGHGFEQNNGLGNPYFVSNQPDGNGHIPSSHHGGNSGGGDKALPIILGILLAVILAVGAYFLFANKDDAETDNKAASSSSSSEAPPSDNPSSGAAESSSASSASSASEESSENSASESTPSSSTDPSVAAAPNDPKKWGGDDTLPAQYRSGLPFDTSTMVQNCRNGSFEIYHYGRGGRVSDGNAEGTRCSMGKSSPSPYSSVTYLTSKSYASNRIKAAKVKNFHIVKDSNDSFIAYGKSSLEKGLLVINPARGVVMELNYPKDGTPQKILDSYGVN